MSSQLSVPPDAITLYPSPDFPTFLPEYISYEQSTVAKTNAGLISQYMGSCNQWQIINSRNRDENQPLTPKPVPVNKWVLNVINNPDGSVTFWQAQTGDPVGPPCPDLPAYVTAPVVPPGTPVFGPQQPNGQPWWAVMPGDNVPIVPWDAPRPNAATVIITPGMTLPVGITPPVGIYQKIPGMIGAWYLKTAIFFLAVCLLVPAIKAQTVVKFSPEPMAVPMSQLSNARNLGRWVEEGCNVGQTPMILSAEQLSIAASSLSFVDNGDASLTLNNQAQRTTWGYIKQYGSLAAQGLAIALTIVNSRANANWAIGLGVGSTVVPQLVTIAAGQVPSPAPLLTVLQYPITVNPGSCFTDHRFAAKMKNPLPIVVIIPVVGESTPSAIPPKFTPAPPQTTIR